MKLAAVVVLALLLLPARAFGGPIDNGQAAKEPLVVSGRDYGVTKASVEDKIRELAFLAGGDQYFHKAGSSKGEYLTIDMASRKNAFTDEGWEEYQKYVGLAKSLLRPRLTWNISFDEKTEQFAEGANHTVVFSADGLSTEADWDETGGGRKGHLTVTFIRTAASPEIIITGWKFDPVGLAWPPAAIPDAIDELRTKAKNGDTKAQFTLGDMYEFGNPRNHAEGLKWYRMTADQGDPAAQARMGDAYREGWGIDKDDKEMAKWYGRAAEGGDKYSQKRIGNMYWNGQGGLDKDPVKGYMWHKLGGDSDVALDRVAAKMTPDQVAEAERRAAEWKPTPAPPQAAGQPETK